MMFNFLNSNSGAISSLSIIIAGFWGFIKFREYLKDRRFITYHKLIKELVEGENQKNPLKLDRQIAVIYELRNFPNYFEVSKRILLGLRDYWNGHNKRIDKEINLTIEYIDKWWHKKIF